jgi:hypothetical protein
MQARRNISFAYPSRWGLIATLPAPFAGLTGIAYRLARFSLPRQGAVLLAASIFYLF